jgi:hypothetical protein
VAEKANQLSTVGASLIRHSSGQEISFYKTECSLQKSVTDPALGQLTHKLHAHFSFLCLSIVMKNISQSEIPSKFIFFSTGRSLQMPYASYCHELL